MTPSRKSTPSEQSGAIRYSWTQPVCNHCWDEKHPDRPSDRRIAGGVCEVCAYCGRDTHSGIYVRDDPATVPFPAEKD